METVKRGYVPKDTVEFCPRAAARLNAAVQVRVEPHLDGVLSRQENVGLAY